MTDTLRVAICRKCKHSANDHACLDCDALMFVHREFGEVRGEDDHGGCEVKGCPCDDLSTTHLEGLEAAVWLTENGK